MAKLCVWSDLQCCTMSKRVEACSLVSIAASPSLKGARPDAPKQWLAYVWRPRDDMESGGRNLHRGLKATDGCCLTPYATLPDSKEKV